MSTAVHSAFVVDLLALSPFYDRYLVEALDRQLDSALLYAATFPYEPGYWGTVPARRAAHLHDRVAGMGIRNKRLRRVLQVGEYAANWTRLIRDARQLRPDVVHVQWLPLLEMVPVELALIRQLQRTGTAVVYTAHNALPHDRGDELLPRYRRAYETFDHIIVHTRSEQERLVELLGVADSRISVVPHGPMFHDLPKVARHEARSTLGLSPNAEVVLFLGLLRPYKGLEDLLEAMRSVVASRPQARLVLAGQGEPAYERALREHTERLGVSAHVELLSRYIPVDEIPTLYAAADVTTLPYREATQSGALFTAASFDAPMVATSVGGMAEVLEGTDRARLVAPADPDSLGAAIQELLAEPPSDRRTMAARLKDWAAHECGWDAIARATIAAYGRALQ